MPRKRPAAAAAAAEQPAQRPRGEELAKNFEVEGPDGDVELRTLEDDPWHVIRKGIMIKPYTSWWDPNDKSTDRSGNDCELVGYVAEHTYTDRKKAAAYILGNSWDGATSYYAMEPKGVWKN